MLLKHGLFPLLLGICVCVRVGEHVGIHQPANEIPFKWHFAGGPIMAQQ